MNMMEDYKQINKHWTKYLTETRKVWDGQNDFRTQKGLKNVQVLDIYEKGEHVKSIIVNTKTDEILGEISLSHINAYHQMDFIRLQNELDNLDQQVKETFFKRLFKQVRHFTI